MDLAKNGARTLSGLRYSLCVHEKRVFGLKRGGSYAREIMLSEGQVHFEASEGPFGPQFDAIQIEMPKKSSWVQALRGTLHLPVTFELRSAKHRLEVTEFLSNATIDGRRNLHAFFDTSTRTSWLGASISI